MVGKAPERACLRIGNWPEADRTMWQTACATADLLDEDIGARANHSAASNRKAERGYGRWLTFLVAKDPDCIAECPAKRITAERVTFAAMGEAILSVHHEGGGS